MKRIHSYITLIFITLFMCGCSDNGLYDELPPQIRNFLAKYYPNTAVDSYTHNSNVYHVKLKNSAGLTFDNDYKWEAVNGYGVALPQVFLYDQLPPELFDYLQETENLNNVMSAEKSAWVYTVALVSDTVTYNVNTGRIMQYY